MGSTIDGGIKIKTTVSVPVAIDILWTRRATTGFCIVEHKVRDGVADMAVVTVKNDTALIFRDVVLVIGVKRIGELWLQSRITFCDKERIGVVGDIEQLGDIGLTGVATIVNPNIMLVTKLIVEVDGRCQIGDIANGIDIDTTIILNEV